ncbi:MAG: phage tail tape measure protein, partial [Thermoguttaceae bacterium]|nr:phage tail tape measure protein [Thermoguttaceae bacterium]
MSETRINSDGSATLTISGSSAPLEKALDAALKALSAFVAGASKKLGAFDGIATTTFDRVADAAGKALNAFDSFRRTDFKFNVPKPAPQASGSGGGGGSGSGEKKTSAPAPNDKSGNRDVDLSFPSFAFDMAGLEAVKSFGRQALDAFVGFGDEMDKMSQRTGFAVETLSAFSHAAGQCGTDLGTVEGAIRGFQSVLGDAANGSKDAAEKFERIGLNVAELVNLAPEEQFRRIMRAVASVENPTLRAAAAMEIFGDAGAQLGPMINGGADALDAYLKEAQEAGVVMSGEQAASAAALSDAFGRLKASFQGLSLTLAEKLVPSVRQGVDAFAKIVAAINGLAETYPVFSTLIKLAGGASAAALAIFAGYGQIAKFSAAVAGATKALWAFSAAAATNPLTWVAAATVALGYLGAKYYEAAGYVGQFSDAAAKATEEGDKARRSMADKFEFLKTVANSGELEGAAFEKAKGYVDELQGALGDLGLSYDETTKKITMATDAQDKFNAKMREGAIKDLEAQIAEEQKNFAEAEKEEQGVLNRQASFGARVAFAPRNLANWVEGGIGKLTGNDARYFDSVAAVMSAEVDAAGDKKSASLRKLNDLRQRLAALKEGETEAAFGDAPSDASVQNEASSVAVASKEAEAKAVEDLNARIAKAEEDRAAREMSASERRIAAIKKETKELTDAIDVRLEALRASASTEDDFAEIHRLETAKAGIEADGKARVADVEKEEADKKDAERERLNAQIAAEEERVADESRTDEERRLAQIDKETAAYKELLADALKLAETEEERADAQGSAKRLGQLVGDADAARGQFKEGFVFAQILQRLVIAQHGEQRRAGAARCAQGNGGFHDALHGVGAEPALVAFRRAGFAGQVGAHIVAKRFGIVAAGQPLDGILQAEGGDDQRRAAQKAHEAHHRAQLVAHQVAHDHFAVEGKARPQRGDALQQDALAILG